MTFFQKITAAVDKNHSLLCIGLDSDLDKLPEFIRKDANAQFLFNSSIIDATHDLVCAYKPNSAFYEARGSAGIEELKMTCDYLRVHYPDIPIILDAKRADIGNTNEGYAVFAFDYLGADAITLHPYLGRQALQPFLDRREKGCFILCKTSNPGAGEFQDLALDTGNQSVKLYQLLAKKIAEEWNENGNCGLVVGGTYPGELEIVRRIAKHIPLLIPGIGTQGGDIQKSVKAGVDSDGQNAIINSSRAIIFAGSGSDFAQKARASAEILRDQINGFRLKGRNDKTL